MAFKNHGCYAFRLMMAIYLLGNLLTTLSTPIPMELEMVHSVTEFGSTSKPFYANTALRGEIGSDLSRPGSDTTFVDKKSFGSDNSFARSGHHDRFIEKELNPSAESRPTTEQKKDGIVDRLRKYKNERFRKGAALVKELFPEKNPKQISPIDSAPKRFFKTLFKPFTLLYKSIKEILSKALTKIRSKPVKGVEDSAVINHPGSSLTSHYLDAGGARSFGSSSKSSFGVDNQHLDFHPHSPSGYEGSSSRSEFDTDKHQFGIGQGLQREYDADESSRSLGSSTRSSFDGERVHSEPFGFVHPQSGDGLHFPIDDTHVWNQNFKGDRHDSDQTASRGSTDGIENEIDSDKLAKARELETITRETTPHSPTRATNDDQIAHVSLNDIIHSGSEGSQADKVKAQVDPTSYVTPKADHTPSTESKTPYVESKTRVQDSIKVDKNPSNQILKLELNTPPAQKLHFPAVEVVQEPKDPALTSNDATLSPIESSRSLKVENPPVVKTPQVVQTPRFVPDSPEVKNPSVADTPEVLKTPPVAGTSPAANIPPVEAVKTPHVSKEEVTNASKARSELSNEISKTQPLTQEGVIKDEKVNSGIPLSLEASHGDTEGSPVNIGIKDTKDHHAEDLIPHPADTSSSKIPFLSLADAFKTFQNLLPLKIPNWLHRDPQDEEFIEDLAFVSQRSDSLPKLQ